MSCSGTIVSQVGRSCHGQRSRQQRFIRDGAISGMRCNVSEHEPQILLREVADVRGYQGQIRHLDTEPARQCRGILI